MTKPLPFLTIDGREVTIEGERNLLELVRKAEVELPTFCYHSELSVYGACRLCLVDVNGRGIQAACSTPPEPGLVVRTQTPEIREIRRISIELLLANHDQSCATCLKSASCKLQSLARQLGVQKVRFKPVHQPVPVDDSSPSLVRDAGKCVLCGDCVRVCSEIQHIGAIDFVFRGSQATVAPAFGKDLAEVECVGCGQCASVCPTGALAPKPEIDEVWAALGDPQKLVVAQVAPAVRVGLGEMFGLPAGQAVTGQMVAALKRLGFDEVYDTSFAADLTVIEEGTEFLARKAKGERLPLFTSCCPAWVRFAEQDYPELLPNLSTCRSPQQMFGSLVREILPAQRGIAKKDLVVVSIMPCTAKKLEARREELAQDGARDVDFVLTTQELGRMIEASGLRFAQLPPESFDMPFGFTTGAGVLFGNSGGVSEAVLRFAVEKVTGKPAAKLDYVEVRGESGLREATVPVNGTTLRIALVHGLANARTVAERVKAGEADYDLVEVMACPGGCVSGAGQPVSADRETRRRRTQGIYAADKALPLHRSQENLFVERVYQTVLGEPGSHEAHRLLHTHYRSRRRTVAQDLPLVAGHGADQVPVSVCLGTSCYLKGSQQLLQGLLRHADEHGLEGRVDVRGAFCHENCEHGPTVTVGGRTLSRCSLDDARQAVEEEL